MVALKERAVDMINRLSDDKVVIVIKYLQDIAAANPAKTTPQKGTIEYLFKDYTGGSFRTELVNPTEAVGAEKW
jgi:hypothetical protein